MFQKRSIVIRIGVVFELSQSSGVEWCIWKTKCLSNLFVKALNKYFYFQFLRTIKKTIVPTLTDPMTTRLHSHNHKTTMLSMSSTIIKCIIMAKIHYRSFRRYLRNNSKRIDFCCFKLTPLTMDHNEPQWISRGVPHHSTSDHSQTLHNHHHQG